MDLTLVPLPFSRTARVNSTYLGTFVNPGNGQYREELRRAVAVIQDYLQAHALPEARALLRLDGQYGTAAVLADLAGLSFVMRGKDYQLLDRPEVQARLHLPPDQQFARSESGSTRTLYDCPDLPLGPAGHRCRVVVATHPATEQKRRVGRESPLSISMVVVLPAPFGPSNPKISPGLTESVRWSTA